MCFYESILRAWWLGELRGSTEVVFGLYDSFRGFCRGLVGFLVCFAGCLGRLRLACFGCGFVLQIH